jgi:hypothetical protein
MPVRVIVALDSGGRLARTPTILRETPAKPDRDQLRAESEAIRAVIACAPYPAVGESEKSILLGRHP